MNSPRYAWSNEYRGDDPFVIIQITLSGEGRFGVGASEWPVRAHEAFIAIVPESTRYFYPAGADGPWTFAWLNLYGAAGIAAAAAFRALHGPVVRFPRGGDAESAWDDLMAKGGRAGRDRTEITLACHRLMVTWSRELAGPDIRRRDPVETALRMIESRFREPLAVKSLAAECGMTREHFTRVFVAATGVSPALYLRGVRAERAAAMLAAGTVTQREAALRAGFPSPKAMRRALEARGRRPGDGRC